MARAGHRIVCAAVKLRDGRVVCGVRHFDELMLQVMPPNTESGRAMLKGHEQGFVDNDYQFHNRTDAWRIAARAGQIRRQESTVEGCLFSEDLY